MPLYPMRFALSPGKSERTEAVVTLPEEMRSILHGTVFGAEGQRVKDAIVRLFLCEEEKLSPAGDTFTDDEGEFIFGPLMIDKKYIVKIYSGGVTLREITVRPKKKRVQ